MVRMSIQGWSEVACRTPSTSTTVFNPSEMASTGPPCELSDIYVSTSLNTRFLLQVQAGSSGDSIRQNLTELQTSQGPAGIGYVCNRLWTSTDKTVDGFLYAPGYRFCGEHLAAGSLPISQLALNLAERYLLTAVCAQAAKGQLSMSTLTFPSLGFDPSLHHQPLTATDVSTALDAHSHMPASWQWAHTDFRSVL